MSEKKDKGKRPAIRPAASPATRPALKVSLPIKFFLMRQKKVREAALLEKQRLMLNKMKEEYKQRKAVVKSENNDVAPKNINRGKKRAPEVPPLPIPIKPCEVHRPPPLPPKRHRHVPQVADVPRPQVPPRFYVDYNNNIAVEQRLMQPGENRRSVEQNVTQNLG